MNVFARYTLRSLTRSPARTLVTIIGILLSMALFTAVIEGAYSGLQYLIRVEEEQNGAYHGIFWGLTEEETGQVLEDGELDRTATWQNAGWAEIDPEYRFNSYPFLLFADVSEGFEELVAVHMKEGRMPENGEEIALPESYEWYLPEEEIVRVGDTLTFAVGRRLAADGTELGEEKYYEQGESLAGTAKRIYTVVGIYKDMDYNMIGGIPARVALTRGGGTGETRVLFTLKHPSRYDAWSQSVRPLNVAPHTSLLRYYGVFGRELLALLYGFAGVLSFLIAFGSVSLIYNSFSISISQRVKQFGLLKSVGATKKQIRDTVLLEALYLSAVGIPAGLIVGCAGIGITLWALRDTFASLLGYAGLETRIGLALNPAALLAACAVCLLTVLISAWLPARRAIKLTAIQAIRQSNQVNVEAKDVRVPPLTGRLFGFPGLMAAKSFKRDRKRRRATVFSLFLSVTLFISASSLCAYVTDSVRIMTRGSAQTDVLAFGNWQFDEDAENPDETLALLSTAEGVTEGLYYFQAGGPDWYDAALLTDEFRAGMGSAIQPYVVEETEGVVRFYNTQAIFLNDEAFRALCRDSGVDPEDYFDPDHPQALFYNHYADVYEDEAAGQRRWGDWPFLESSAFPAEAWEQTPREIEGYTLVDTEQRGDAFYHYYPTDELPSNWEERDKSLDRVLSEEEVLVTTAYRLGAAIDEVPFAFASTEPILFYPRSVAEAVLGEEEQSNVLCQYAFRSQSPALTCASMYNMMEAAGLSGANVSDQSQYNERTEMFISVVNVFAYGFITLISLIAAANVFNTISTNVSLRQREFAMLRSIGLSERGMRRMMNYECTVYGIRGLAWGLPTSVVMTYIIYRVASQTLTINFYVPWTSVAVAVGSVFAVVFAAMAYAARWLRKNNLAETLKLESF